MVAGAVLCMACGYDTRSGRRQSMQMETEPAGGSGARLPQFSISPGMKRVGVVIVLIGAIALGWGPAKRWVADLSSSGQSDARTFEGRTLGQWLDLAATGNGDPEALRRAAASAPIDPAVAGRLLDSLTKIFAKSFAGAVLDRFEREHIQLARGEILQKLDARAEETSRGAIRLLARLAPDDSEVAARLTGMLQNEQSVYRRKDLIEALGGFRHEPAAEALLKLASESSDENERTISLAAAAKSGSGRAIEMMLEQIRTITPAWKRDIFIRNLGDTGEAGVAPLGELLNSDDSKLRLVAYGALIRSGPAAVSLLDRISRDYLSDPATRSSSSAILANIGAPAYGAFRRALSSPDSNLRADAVGRLGAAPELDAATLTAVLAVVDDPTDAGMVLMFIGRRLQEHSSFAATATPGQLLSLVDQHPMVIHGARSRAEQTPSEAEPAAPDTFAARSWAGLQWAVEQVSTAPKTPATEQVMGRLRAAASSAMAALEAHDLLKIQSIRALSFKEAEKLPGGSPRKYTRLEDGVMSVWVDDDPRTQQFVANLEAQKRTLVNDISHLRHLSQ
jgi:hypothetical protein